MSAGFHCFAAFLLVLAPEFLRALSVGSRSESANRVEFEVGVLGGTRLHLRSEDVNGHDDDSSAESPSANRMLPFRRVEYEVGTLGGISRHLHSGDGNDYDSDRYDYYADGDGTDALGSKSDDDYYYGYAVDYYADGLGAGSTTAATKCGSTCSIRKEIHDMSDKEFDQFAEGINKLKESGEWDNITKMHEEKGQHGNFNFLAWHRYYLAYVESRIRDVMNDCSITIPYWNWALEQGSAKDSIVWGATRYGSMKVGAAGCVDDGQFGKSSEFSGDCIRRGSMPRGGQSEADFLKSFSITRFNWVSIEKFLATTKAADFPLLANTIEWDYHGTPHVRIGGSSGHMLNPATASYDPIFFAHHAFVDYMWYAWQAANGGTVNRSKHVDRAGLEFPSLKENGTPQHVKDFESSGGMTVDGEDVCVRYANKETSTSTPTTPNAARSLIENDEVALGGTEGVDPAEGQQGQCENVKEVNECIESLGERLKDVPRIDSEQCSPLNKALDGALRVWLEGMVKMDCIQSEEVEPIVKKELELAEKEQNGKSAPAADADECDKSLCFKRSALLELCGREGKSSNSSSADGGLNDALGSASGDSGYDYYADGDGTDALGSKSGDSYAYYADGDGSYDYYADSDGTDSLGSKSADSGYAYYADGDGTDALGSKSGDSYAYYADGDGTDAL